MVSTSQSVMANMSGAASTVQLRLENGEQVLLPLPPLGVNASGCARPVLSGAMLQVTDNSAGPSPPTNRRPFFRVTKDEVCHRQIFGRETLSDLTAKSNAIEMKRGLQVLCDACSQDNVAL
jgi:hypothetical protein